MCETPPVENKKMTRFALGSKCGFFAANGSFVCRRSSAASSCARIPGKSSEPPTRERSTVRRLQLRAFGKKGDCPPELRGQSPFFPNALTRNPVMIFHRSMDVNKLVRHEQHPREA